MARHIPAILDLVRGTTHLGTIEVKEGEADLPWYSGAFRPAPAFEAVRGLFERELELLQANTADDDAQWDDWEAVHEELHEPGLHLRSPDKAFTFGECLIHIKGAEAWWRTPDDGRH